MSRRLISVATGLGALAALITMLALVVVNSDDTQGSSKAESLSPQVFRRWPNRR